MSRKKVITVAKPTAIIKPVVNEITSTVVEVVPVIEKTEPVVEVVPVTETTETIVEVVPVTETTSTEVVEETLKEVELPVFPATETVEASKTSAFEDESEKLFKEYPDATSFHFSSDGLAFFTHNDARNHGLTLTDKQVISKVRK